MKWMEIISIQFAAGRGEEKITEILSQIAEAYYSSLPSDVRLFERTDFSGDLSLFLVYKNYTEKPGKSDLGRTLAHLLSEFGRVSHSVWGEKLSYSASDCSAGCSYKKSNQQEI